MSVNAVSSLGWPARAVRLRVMASERGGLVTSQRRSRPPLKGGRLP